MLMLMAAEAAALEAVAGGSVTDAVAAWLAPTYAHAAWEQLAKLQGEARLNLLQTFVHDWALLRDGDQTTERLKMEWKRLEILREMQFERFKSKTVVGLEALLTHVKKNPKARAAFDALSKEMVHPWDPREQGPIGGPPESWEADEEETSTAGTNNLSE